MKNEHMKYVELNTKLVEMTLKLESADNIKRKCLSLEAQLEESKRMSESIRIERDDIQKICQEQKSALDHIDSQNYQEKYEANYNRKRRAAKGARSIEPNIQKN